MHLLQRRRENKSFLILCLSWIFAVLPDLSQSQHFVTRTKGREKDANNDYTQLTKTCPMFYDADRSSPDAVTCSREGGHMLKCHEGFCELAIMARQQENMAQVGWSLTGRDKGDQNKG